MADVSPSGTEQNERRDRRSLLVLLVLLLLLIGLYVLVALWLGLWPFARQVETQVIAPEIRSFEDLRKYTDGKPLPEASTGRRVPGLQQDDHLRGDPSAPVTVVLYTNIQNSYTPLAIEALNQLLEENGQVLHWVFRHYPLNDRALDFPAALAAECLSLEGGDEVFFTYLDMLFRAELSKDAITALADIALPGATKFDPCMRGELLSDYVYIDKQEAQLEGEIFTTPTVVFIRNETNEQWFVEGLETPEYLNRTLAEVMGR